MALEIMCVELIIRLALPDIAHDTATVAAAVNIKNENGKPGDAAG